MKKPKLVGIVLTVIVVMGVITAVSYVWYSPFTWGWTIHADAGGDKIVHVNETCVFNGSESCAASGCIGGVRHKILLVWDFDESDGINGDAVGINVSHKYTKVGNYTVTLIVILMEDIEAPQGHQGVKKGQMAEDKVNVTVVQKVGWGESFEEDYAFRCVEGTFLPSGTLFTILENGFYYVIDYKYTVTSANSSYENTSKEEIDSLLEYIGFWRTNYSITKAEKGCITNCTQLFNNQTQINSFMELNNSYTYSEVLDASYTIIGIKNNEQRHRVSIYAYEEDGSLPVFDRYHQQLTTLKDTLNG